MIHLLRLIKSGRTWAWQEHITFWHGSEQICGSRNIRYVCNIKTGIFIGDENHYHANSYMQLPKQNICLLLGVEVGKCSHAVVLVGGSIKFEWQCRGGAAGQQRLQVGLRRQLLLLQSLQGLGSLL